MLGGGPSSGGGSVSTGGRAGTYGGGGNSSGPSGASASGGSNATGGTLASAGSGATGGTGTGGTSTGGARPTGGTGTGGTGTGLGGTASGGASGGSANSYPDRGSVGYAPSRCPAGLKVVDSTSSAPAGTTWNSRNGYLDAAGSATLNCVHVKGGLYISGPGTFTLTNSIVEGGAAWFVVTREQSSNGPLLLSDSTLRWRDGLSVNPAVGNGAGVIQPSGDQSGSRIIGNDISGNPDGIQLYGRDWVVRGNWIHGLARVGTPPDNTHNDGMQVYGGTDIVIENNRIELGGFDGVHQNGALFFQVDSLPGVKILGNYLEGGGFILRLEENVTDAIVRDNVFGPPDTSVVTWPGYVLLTGNASVAEWTNNCQGDSNGVKYLPCRAVDRP